MQGCAAATWDARLVKYSLPRMRVRRRRQIYRSRGRTERCAATRPLSRRRVRSRGARRAEGHTELRHVHHRPALNRTSDRRDRRGACVGLPTTTQDQPALSYKAIKLAGTTNHFDALRRFFAVRRRSNYDLGLLATHATTTQVFASFTRRRAPEGNMQTSKRTCNLDVVRFHA